ncbi:unnamed protein product [Protopolystoma xenopodis]|uniref:Uncharacterized protein n=1 Tax=Protopolystoma xenopodis TaxID=117903 RepID=A0A3S5BZI4_9PLAT|nr:unnamed protein product [Protopolystoma xenopodis]
MASGTSGIEHSAGRYPSLLWQTALFDWLLHKLSTGDAFNRPNGWCEDRRICTRRYTQANLIGFVTGFLQPYSLVHAQSLYHLGGHIAGVE